MLSWVSIFYLELPHVVLRHSIFSRVAPFYPELPYRILSSSSLSWATVSYPILCELYLCYPQLFFVILSYRTIIHSVFQFHLSNRSNTYILVSIWDVVLREDASRPERNCVFVCEREGERDREINEQKMLTLPRTLSSPTSSTLPSSFTPFFHSLSLAWLLTHCHPSIEAQGAKHWVVGEPNYLTPFPNCPRAVPNNPPYRCRHTAYSKTYGLHPVLPTFLHKVVQSRVRVFVYTVGRGVVIVEVLYVTLQWGGTVKGFIINTTHHSLRSLFSEWGGV